MKICLTANSGGHLNQLLQLKPFYENHEYFFLTNKTPFSEELSRFEKVYFVEKFIIKEMLSKLQFIKPFKNLYQTIKPFYKEKPDVIITTGAGVSLGACLIGKLIRCRIVFIESIARTNSPSTFGKLAKYIADLIFVQWRGLQTYYSNSIYSGIIFNFNNINDDIFKTGEIKKILVTFGTYKLQFNRILIELDNLKKSGELKAEIVAQIGASDYIPENFEYFDYCGQSVMHSLISESDLIICQGGSGSIMDSLMMGKRVIAIPRLKCFGEFLDDHQLELVKEMEDAGLILAVYNIHDLFSVIKSIEKFKPKLNELKNFSIISQIEKLF